ncbi:LCP family protein [Smaragdicoccus niigatensis]|uniref:LCP family protein n=1 Tax=Smaragdicoccus niigatensis TaxID=359359 RepID=UPI00035F3BA3|nr:LCP family protein [Smaragdicoccus niigatensis]
MAENGAPPERNPLSTKAKPRVLLPRRPARHSRSRNRPILAAGRSFVAFASVLVLFGTGALWMFKSHTDRSFTQVSALEEASPDIVAPETQLGDENFLIVGTDSRAGANGAVGAGTESDVEGARSDVMMVVHIPSDRSRVVVVNFPRDLEIDRPTCTSWDNSAAVYSDEEVSPEDQVKLNSAYQLGGPKCLVRVIQRLTGLRIGHFVGTDFAGFEKMVDTIGGVELCTTEPLIDGELGPVLEKTGRQVVPGSVALNYVRARTIESEGTGDYGRIKRQQLFLSSLLRSVLSQKVLLDPARLNGFIAAFTENTFVEKVTTTDLFTLATSLRNVEPGVVTFITVPTSGTSEWGNEIPRVRDISAIFQAIRTSAPLPGESSTAKKFNDRIDHVDAVEPGTVSVSISNASGNSNTGQDVGDSLTALGFSVSGISGYSGTSVRTLVRFTPEYEAEAMTLASTIPGAVLVRVSESEVPIELVIGSDFHGQPKDPAKPGTVIRATIVDEETANDLPPDLSYTNAADQTCA